MADTILVKITLLKNPKRRNELHYLIDYHKEVIVDSYNPNLTKKYTELCDNCQEICNDCPKALHPWFLIKNNGRGIFLAKKIAEKFHPWVSLSLQTDIVLSDIPEEIRSLNKWLKKTEQEMGKTKLNLN